MGILKKILGNIGGAGATTAGGLSGEQSSCLKQAFQPLEKAGAQLPGEALAFVLEGTSESVLLALQTTRVANLGDLLGDPGRMRSPFYLWNDPATRAIGEKSLAARARFYASIDADRPPLALLIRLGKLLAAVDAGQSLDRPGAPVPDWLQYLVNDALFASFDRLDTPKRNLPQSRPAWAVPLFAALLAHDGLEPELVLPLMFECQGLGSSYYHDCLDAISAPAAAADFMRANPAAVEALPAQLSAAGRLALAKRIGGDKGLLVPFAALFVRLAVDASKSVRAEAATGLEGLPEAQRLDLLGRLLAEGDGGERAQAAELLARVPGEAARTLLDAALGHETSKPVQQSIRAALSRLDAAGDAGAVALPPAPPWQPFDDSPLGDDAMQLLIANRSEILEAERRAAQAEIEANKGKPKKEVRDWAQKSHATFAGLGDDDLRAALRVLDGQASPQDLKRAASHDLNRLVAHRGRLAALPSCGPAHLIRWLQAADRWGSFWDDADFQKWLARQPAGSVDLRALAEVLRRAGLPLSDVARCALVTGWRQPSAADVLPAECIWPFFAEHPAFIDEGLGLCPPVAREGRHRVVFDFAATLRTLACFPSLPARWLPPVMEIALGEGKTHRAAAQQALSMLPDIGRRIAESLKHSKSEVRIEAANWLAELNYRDAIPALTGALDKESRETVRAALLTALEALGVDIAPRLAPALLLAEAKKGLKARPPAGLGWFALDALPACRWADGSAVEPEILRWWVVLACKLKEPGGNALLTRYLGLLEGASRQQLGSSVLRQFIAHDTRHPSADECNAHAAGIAPHRWQDNQDAYLKADPRDKTYYEPGYQKSQEQVFEECRREKASEYLGSAINEKGVLALAAGTPGHEAVSLLQQYLRDHYPRRAQIEAMLEGVAAGNDPAVIQLLLGLSRRYRTASVQEKARVLVQEIAARNGWSQDQLADRTIPTAGLDDGGRLALQYGERVFTVVLDGALKLELRNPEGKAVKALPEPRQGDDAAQVKEAKAQFATSRKELKQVIALQTARLFEALCTGRLWPQDEWRDYLHAHPIVGRLIQRLVWLEQAPDGRLRGSFRCTEDGSLIDTADDEVTLAADSRLRLAHASLVDAATASAWQRHLADYAVVPLFAQMSRQRPAVAFVDAQGRDVTEIVDRLGWISDTFTLRGCFDKLGYQRAQSEDGGFFHQYTKEFASVGVRVAIDFSGNTLPEENVTAALKGLSFEDSRSRNWGERALPLKQVPPVLLAEAYADYHAVARACAGFDPEWEGKMPW